VDHFEVVCTKGVRLPKKTLFLLNLFVVFLNNYAFGCFCRDKVLLIVFIFPTLVYFCFVENLISRFTPNLTFTKEENASLCFDLCFFEKRDKPRTFSERKLVFCLIYVSSFFGKSFKQEFSF